VFPTDALGGVEPGQLAQRGDDALARPARGADRFDQGPRFIDLAVLLATAALEKHGWSSLLDRHIVARERKLGNGVVATTRVLRIATQ
jgi:hypothetical protein